MTWYRNRFLDTESSYAGSIQVEPVAGGVNNITFLTAENAVSYTLYGRLPGQSWVELEQRAATGDIQNNIFVDDGSWTGSSVAVEVEYKVELRSEIPETQPGHYIADTGSRGGIIDPDPANRVPGIYEKVFYQAGDKEINDELSSRSTWDVNANAGKYEATLRTGFNTTTTIGGQVVDWSSGSYSQINNLSDEDFTQHLLQLRDRWIDWIADNIRDKIANRGLVMSELDAYLSDAEIHLADNAFSGGLSNAGFYQHGARIGYTPSNNEITSNPYFRFDESTGLASATNKANIFVDVWLLGMYFTLIGPGYEDLELEGIFTHYNLPYRIPTGKLNAFNSVPVLSAMDRTQRTQFLLNVYKTMHGDGFDVIEGFDHEGIQSAYDLCGTFVDFYPATFADQMDSFMAFIDALEAFGSPGKNTLMSSGGFNNSPDVGQILCDDWRGHPDLVNKPYYDERDWNPVTAPPEQGLYGGFPLSVWLYIQDYIVNNTSINLQRFYSWGIDNTIFRWNGSQTDFNRISEFTQKVGGQWGTPYSTPPTETDKQNYAEYRAYGQFTPDKDYNFILRDRPITREFVPDHRPFFAMSLSVQNEADPSLTVNGLTDDCDDLGTVNRIGTSASDHWKMNIAPLDDSESNPLYPPCPLKPWLSHGYSINRKSNPDTTDPNEDFMLRLVHDDPVNPGPLEDAYRRGYRRIMLRGVFGMKTTSSNGSGVPSAIWSAGDPNLEVWNHKATIGRDNPGLEYPFTSNGNLMSDDPTATKGDAQQSVINFLKPWIASKEAAGDPVDVYIYGAYQPAFLANGDPARGNLSMTFYVGDSQWLQGSSINTDSGIPWREHFPLPDMSNPDHVEFFDGECLPWIDIGVKGFIIDGASNGGELPGGGGVPVSNANPPVDRIPGVFPYYRERLGVDVIGEAVPLAQFGPNARMNEDLYRETAFMAYSHDTYWSDMWRNINLSPDDSEIHIFLLWAFNGGWSKVNGVWTHTDPAGGINSAYATIDPTIDGVVYDIAGMKAEIDQMWANGFVVSSNIGRYSSSSPPNEAAAREEIMNYIAQRQSPTSG